MVCLPERRSGEVGRNGNLGVATSLVLLGSGKGAAKPLALVAIDRPWVGKCSIYMARYGLEGNERCVDRKDRDPMEEGWREMVEISHSLSFSPATKTPYQAAGRSNPRDGFAYGIIHAGLPKRRHCFFGRNYFETC